MRIKLLKSYFILSVRLLHKIIVSTVIYNLFVITFNGYMLEKVTYVHIHFID
jgi:hypothetical protein